MNSRVFPGRAIDIPAPFLPLPPHRVVRKASPAPKCKPKTPEAQREELRPVPTAKESKKDRQCRRRPRQQARATRASERSVEDRASTPTQSTCCSAPPRRSSLQEDKPIFRHHRRQALLPEHADHHQADHLYGPAGKGPAAASSFLAPPLPSFFILDWVCLFFSLPVVPAPTFFLSFQPESMDHSIRPKKRAASAPRKDPLKVAGGFHHLPHQPLSTGRLPREKTKTKPKPRATSAGPVVEHFTFCLPPLLQHTGTMAEHSQPNQPRANSETPPPSQRFWVRGSQPSQQQNCPPAQPATTPGKGQRVPPRARRQPPSPTSQGTG